MLVVSPSSILDVLCFPTFDRIKNVKAYLQMENQNLILLILFRSHWTWRRQSWQGLGEVGVGETRRVKPKSCFLGNRGKGTLKFWKSMPVVVCVLEQRSPRPTGVENSWDLLCARPRALQLLVTEGSRRNSYSLIRNWFMILIYDLVESSWVGSVNSSHQNKKKKKQETAAGSGMQKCMLAVYI